MVVGQECWDLRAPYQVRGDPVLGAGQAVIRGLAGLTGVYPC